MRTLILTTVIFLSYSPQVFAKNCPSSDDVAVILKEFLTIHEKKMGEEAVSFSKTFVPQYQLQGVENPSLLMEMDKVELKQTNHGDKISCAYSYGQYGMFSFDMKK